MVRQCITVSVFILVINCLLSTRPCLSLFHLSLLCHLVVRGRWQRLTGGWQLCPCTAEHRRQPECPVAGAVAAALPSLTGRCGPLTSLAVHHVLQPGCLWLSPCWWSRQQGQSACYRGPRRGGRMGPVWQSAVKCYLFRVVLQHSSKQHKCLLEISLFHGLVIL